MPLWSALLTSKPEWVNDYFTPCTNLYRGLFLFGVVPVISSATESYIDVRRGYEI